MFNAIYRGDAKEVLRRLDAGPTLLEARGTGSVQTTPLMYAASVGRLQIVQLLTGKGANLEATSRHGRTVLHHAAESGHEEVVAYLLENGVHSHRQDSSGLTAMMLALDKRHVRVALLLLEHMKGQGLEARKKGWTHTALHEAVCMEEEEVVACLLRHGARADSRTYRRITPLHYAASRGSLGIVRRLLKHVTGQGLNARNIQGSTALDFAVFSDRVENIKALLLAGADPTITDNQGETSRAVAERRNFPCAPVFRVSPCRIHICVGCTNPAHRLIQGTIGHALVLSWRHMVNQSSAHMHVYV